jgi:hypothetical protein
MHSKGSYHSYGGKNEGWRRHMTMAVTDERCLITNAPLHASIDPRIDIEVTTPSPHRYRSTYLSTSAG